MSRPQRLIGPTLAEPPSLARLREEVAAVSATLSDMVSLIASENLPTTTVRELLADGLLAAKTAEGWPGKRYHAGCGPADAIENLALAALRDCLGGEHANVQVMTASIANRAVIEAVVSQTGHPRILALDVRAGGHISHRHPRAETQYYSVEPDTNLLDYAALRALAHEFRPNLIIAGSSAYPRQIDFAAIANIAREVGARLHADISHIAGLVAAGLHPSPVSRADYVTGSTYKTLCGPRSGFIISQHRVEDDVLLRRIDRNVFPGLQSSPNLAQIAAKAACFIEAAAPAFRTYTRQLVDHSRLLARELMARSWPVVTGGTDTHMLLVDVAARGLTGRIAQDALEAVGIICNRNLIPFDPQPPAVTSGIRLGTAQFTARGGNAATLTELAGLIDRVLTAVQPIDHTSFRLPRRVRQPVARAVRSIAAEQLRDLRAAFRFADD